MSLLADQIVGKNLISALLPEGLELSFGEVSLSIYNPFSVEKHGRPLAFMDLVSLVPLRVVNVEVTECQASIHLEQDVSIHVDLRPEAYAGPEAMVLRMGEKGLVVWQ